MIEQKGLAVFNKAVAETITRAVCTISGKDYTLPIKSVEDMIVYGNICLKQFPKHERYALASEIRICMYRILGIVIETNHKHYKKTTLTELDIEVDKLRSYLRLSANPELKYLSVDKYGNWAAMVDEIGRMVGGWIQSVSK